MIWLFNLQVEEVTLLKDTREGDDCVTFKVTEDQRVKTGSENIRVSFDTKDGGGEALLERLRVPKDIVVRKTFD